MHYVRFKDPEDIEIVVPVDKILGLSATQGNKFYNRSTGENVVGPLVQIVIADNSLFLFPGTLDEFLDLLKNPLTLFMRH